MTYARAPLYDGVGNGVLGSTDLKIKIRRTGDGWFLDYGDQTFKPNGHAVKEETMVETDPVELPGEYEWSQATATWDDGDYTLHYDNGDVRTIPYKDMEEWEVKDGEVVTNKVVKTKVDTVDTKVDTVDTKVGTVDAKVTTVDTKVGTVDTKVTTVDTKVDAVKVDTAEVTDIITPISDVDPDKAITSRLAVANTDTISDIAITDDAATKIAASILSSVIDGTSTMKDVLKMIFALAPGKRLVKNGNVYTYYDQSDVAILTLTWSDAEVVGVL